jgi:hypothetical protein
MAVGGRGAIPLKVLCEEYDKGDPDGVVARFWDANPVAKACVAGIIAQIKSPANQKAQRIYAAANPGEKIRLWQMTPEAVIAYAKIRGPLQRRPWPATEGHPRERRSGRGRITRGPTNGDDDPEPPDRRHRPRVIAKRCGPGQVWIGVIGCLGHVLAEDRCAADPHSSSSARAARWLELRTGVPQRAVVAAIWAAWVQEVAA